MAGAGDSKEALAQRVSNINLSQPEQEAGATPRGVDVEVRTFVVVLAQNLAIPRLNMLTESIQCEYKGGSGRAYAV